MVIVPGSFDLGEIARKAYLDLSTPSTLLDTLIEANAAGADGNSITFASTADAALAKAELALDGAGLTTNCDTVVEAHTAGYAGNALKIALTGDAVAAKAELDCGGEGAANIDTVLESHSDGVAGDDYEVILQDGHAGGAQALLDLVTGNQSGHHHQRREVWRSRKLHNVRIRCGRWSGRG